jgi:hypothetical protein
MTTKTWQIHILASALEVIAAMASYEPEDDADDIEAPSGDAVFHHYVDDAIVSLLLEARVHLPNGPAYLTGAQGRAVVVLAWPRAELYFAALGEGLSHWVTLAPDGAAESHPTALDAARAVWGRASAEQAEAGAVEGADAPRYRRWLRGGA